MDDYDLDLDSPVRLVETPPEDEILPPPPVKKVSSTPMVKWRLRDYPDWFRNVYSLEYYTVFLFLCFRGDRKTTWWGIVRPSSPLNPALPHGRLHAKFQHPLHLFPPQLHHSQFLSSSTHF